MNPPALAGGVVTVFLAWVPTHHRPLTTGRLTLTLGPAQAGPARYLFSHSFLSARALSVTAMVADGFTRASESDRKAMTISEASSLKPPERAFRNAPKAIRQGRRCRDSMIKFDVSGQSS